MCFISLYLHILQTILKTILKCSHNNCCLHHCISCSSCPRRHFYKNCSHLIASHCVPSGAELMVKGCHSNMAMSGILTKLSSNKERMLSWENKEESSIGARYTTFHRNRNRKNHKIIMFRFLNHDKMFMSYKENLLQHTYNKLLVHDNLMY